MKFSQMKKNIFHGSISLNFSHTILLCPVRNFSISYLNNDHLYREPNILFSALLSRSRLSLNEQLCAFRWLASSIPQLCSHGSIWKVSVLLVQEEACTAGVSGSMYAKSGKLKLVTVKKGIRVN